MKILHLVGGNLNGGAARGAYWLHKGLLANGIESKILTNSNITFEDHNVHSILTSRKQKLLNYLRKMGDKLPLFLYPKRRHLIFNTSLTGYNFTKHFLYKWADIIHLHWINKGFVNIKHLSKIDKPIVWTIRDMWPMTGGCHIAEAFPCDRYKQDCGKCIQLGSAKRIDLSTIILKRKKRYIPGSIILVGISPWISNCASSSSLFRDYDVRTIYNNINCNEFFPVNQERAREKLSLPKNKKIILAEFHRSNTFFKGFHKFIEAVNNLENKDEYLLTFFGEYEEEIIQKINSFSTKHFGFLKNSDSLRLLYSCADVFVAPTIMDSFGKTLAESMACGTPVVCFNATGPQHIVRHKIDGYKADPYDPKSLKEGINWIFNYQSNDLSTKARESAMNLFDVNVSVKKYLSIYNELIN